MRKSRLELGNRVMSQQVLDKIVLPGWDTPEQREKKMANVLNRIISKNDKGRLQKMRYAHGYKWFGIDGLPAITSIRRFRIAVKCKNLTYFEYECYAPDPEYDDCCIHFSFMEDDLDKIIKHRADLVDFLASCSLSLVEFMLSEIEDKLLYISQFYDIIELLGLDEDTEAIFARDLIFHDEKCYNIRELREEYEKSQGIE